MIEPENLIEAAKSLLAKASGPPSEEAIRRSVSTSYYAVFHLVIRAGADRLFGKQKRSDAGYILLYRGYSHTRLKEIFKTLNVSTYPPKLQLQLKRTSATTALRDFASIFVDLQERRHKADYDAQAVFVESDAEDAIDNAEIAFKRFKRIPSSELADVLALMLLSSRGN